MVIINDAGGHLDLDYTAIYLMLSPEELESHSALLNKLNTLDTLTRELFHFEMLPRADKPFQLLPKVMVRNMRHYNVMVRLVNSIHNIFTYALEEINLEADFNAVANAFNVFINSVCKENINQLDILAHRATSTAADAMDFYNCQKITADRFYNALLAGRNKHADPKPSSQRHHKPDKPSSTKPDKASSADKTASRLEKERWEKFKPSHTPRIKVTVKRVPKGKVLKSGQQRSGIGVEFNIDGAVVPVFFGGTDRTFLYIATLMATLEGRTLRRADFMPLYEAPRADKAAERQRQELKEWLEPRFNALLFSRNFHEWYKGVREDPHSFDVAIGVIRQKLWEALYPDHKEAYYFTFVINDNGNYRIRLSKDSISIDPDILSRIG